MKFRSSKTSQWELFDYHFGSGNLCNSSCIVYSAIISHTSTYVQSIIWLEQQLFSDRLTSASEWVCVCMWMCKLGLFPCFITHTLNRCLFKHIVPASICVETCYIFKTDNNIRPIHFIRRLVWHKVISRIFNISHGSLVHRRMAAAHSEHGKIVKWKHCIAPHNTHTHT